MDVRRPVADRLPGGSASRPEQVALTLRDRIRDGAYPPGHRLAEPGIAEELGISRNTLREAFRLLAHERLLAQELHRGTFVRVPDVDDVIDVYRVRRHVECSAVGAVTAPPPTLDRIAEAVRQGHHAIATQDWRELGSANIAFHLELVATAGSPRLDELMRGVLAALRLVFHAVKNLRWFHEPYLARNQEILDLLADGNGEEAGKQLRGYLDDAEQQLVEACAEHRA